MSAEVIPFPKRPDPEGDLLAVAEQVFELAQEMRDQGFCSERGEAAIAALAGEAALAALIHDARKAWRDRR